MVENLRGAQENKTVTETESENVNVSGFSLTDKSLTNEAVPLKGGGSSDWKSTVYSRGSYTAPNMPLAQFKAFTESGDYVGMDSMNNSKFLKGGAKKKRGKSNRKSYRKKSNRKSYRKKTNRKSKRKSYRKKSNRKSKRKSYRKKSNRKSYRKKSNRKSYRKKSNRGGGSSDWRSTVYSRGSYTAPNMPLAQFKAFTETADYMPNESMRSSAFMK